MTDGNVPLGTIFQSREQVSLAGLHSPHMAGIHPQREGARAESIVISGGYKDDEDYVTSLFTRAMADKKMGYKYKTRK
jgi:hypothetical protein